jgi:sporulation protein YlmC with PRC-barrel domain
MQTSNLLRLFFRSAALATAPVLLALTVHAQTAPPFPAEAPPARKAEPVPVPSPDSPAKAAPDARPVSPDGAKAADPSTGKAADAGKAELLGLAAVGSDGKKVGEVSAVKTEGDGKVVEIMVKTGGFLGLGGKTVAIPADKFAKTGETIQLAMSSADVGKLPALPGDRG